MKLVQLTDCHLFKDISKAAYAGVNPYSSLVACLQLAAAEQPDAVIITGDISGDDSARSYQHLLDAIATHLPGVAWRVIPGNHDANPAFDTYLSDNVIKAGAPWLLENWCIHGLDSTDTGASGYIGQPQLQDTARAIADNPTCHHIVAMHHHPVASNSWMDKHALNNADEVVCWLEQQPQVACVIHGHIHTHRVIKHHGCPVIAAPSTCWQWQMSPEFGVADTAPGLLVFTLKQSGQWTSQLRRIK